jgi:glyoxylase-like metal-dependent hydrolase (beta-lactamase superfamily II)
MSAAERRIIPISLPTPFIVGNVNAYLIPGDPVILIDTGARTDESYQALTSGLNESGYSTRDIDVILITHGHLDHMGLLGRLLKESSAEAYAHPCVVERSAHYEEQSDDTIEFALKLMRKLGTPEEYMNPTAEEREGYKMYGEQVSIGHALKDGQELFGFKVHFVPGHSSSDVLFYDTATNDCITGDHLLKKINPNPLIRRPEPGKKRPKSLVEYHASLRRTRALPIRTCYPGHGDTFDNHIRVIDGLFRRHRRRSGEILNILQDSPATPYELSRALFPDLDPKHLFFGLSVALGHLELLEQSKSVTYSKKSGVRVYRARSGAGTP